MLQLGNVSSERWLLTEREFEDIQEMAEDGQQDLSRTFGGGSEVYFEFCCYPCQEEDRHVEAVGCCKDCSDYLCDDCYKSHHRPRLWRHHVLLDRHHMPKDLPVPRKVVDLDNCTDTCNKHPDNVIEYYCQAHDTLACSVCAFADHRNCQNVDRIPDVADRIRKRKEFTDTRGQLQRLEDKACKILQTSQDNLSVSSKCSDDTITSVKTYRQEVNSTLEKLEKELEADAKQIQSENEKRLKRASAKCSTALIEIKGTIQSISKLEKNKQYCNLFVVVKKAQKTLPTVASDLETIQRDSMVDGFKFEANQQLQRILRQPRGLGNIAAPEAHADARDNEFDRPVGVSDKHPGQSTDNRSAITTDGHRLDINLIKHSRDSSSSSHVGQGQVEEKNAKGSKAKLSSSSSTSTDKTPRQNRDSILPIPTNSRTAKPSRSPATSGTAGEQSKNIQSYDESKKVNARHITDINVDTKTCKYGWITGVAVLSGDKLFAVDYNNESVKVVETNKQTPVYELKLQSKPWDVTSVDNDKVAVTLPFANTIQYLNVSIDGIVSTSGSIDVKGSCYGIAFARDRLWVRYTGKVEMLTLDGKVQLRVSSYAAGQQLYSYPYYIAVSPNFETVCVSDYSKQSVVRLSSTGKLLSVHKDKDLHHPTGISVATDGTIYVCDFIGRSVHMLTTQCEKIKILLNEGQVNGSPQSLAYNEATKQLLVGIWGKIKVFQLS